MAIESHPARATRRRQRLLFDAVADRYDEARPMYPDAAVDFLLTAEIDERSVVSEAGCGTGQLTRQLAGRGVQLTGIDVGPSMIAAARRRMPEGSAAVAFRVVAFEDLAAEDGSFDLIVFADAFHWVDPEARSEPSPELLDALGDGWLASSGVALDVGCGLGSVAWYLQRTGWRVIGVDVSPVALAGAVGRNPGPAHLQADVHRRTSRYPPAPVRSLSSISQA